MRKFNLRLLLYYTLIPLMLAFTVSMLIPSYSDFYDEIKNTFEMEIVDELFNKDNIIKLLDDHKNGVRDNYRKVWAIYSFLKWYSVYFEN